MNGQYSVIIRAINDNQQKFDLELTNVPQFLLDISAIEAGDIGKVFGISSQEFALPGTDINNQFFNNLFDIGTTPAIGLTHTVPCQVLVDGQAVYAGKLYLNSIVTDQYNDVIYNCAVVNETVDFRTRIDNRALADLDWTAYDHTYNWTNISSSWNDQLFSGSIMYPLVHYGKDPNNSGSAQLEFGGGNFQVDNPNFPLRVTDFKPAIKAKDVIDTIFDTVGYRYQSSFITGSFFSNLYLLTSNTANKGAIIEGTVTQSMYAYRNTNQDIDGFGIPEVVQFNAEQYDNGNNFNPSTYTYTADVTGVYTINVNIPFLIRSYSGVSVERYVTVSVLVNSIPVQNFSQALKQIPSGTVGFNPFQRQLNAGDQLQVEIIFEAAPGSGEEFRVRTGTNTFFKVWGPPNTIESTINMGLQFPDNLKVLDFLNGLIQKFNLVIEPVKGQKNLLTIEPFNTWVDQGVVKDWTNKVDRNVKWEIKHPLGDQPKTIKFSDVIDEDEINKYHFSTYGKIYGERTYNSDSDLTAGEKKIGSTFAATPVKQIPNSQTVVVPFLYKKEPDKYGQPYNFKPRLLFKTSLKEVTATEARGVSGSIFNLQRGYFYMNDGSTTFPIDYYRTLLPVTGSPVDYNTGFDIHYNNLGQWPYQQNFQNGWTRNDAYTEFWSFYINELYDVDTRLVTMNIILQPDEIQNIQLNDKIFVDGHYYRINKIQGANLIEEQSTQVELLKTLPRRLKFPRRRIYVNPSEFIDVVQNDLNEGGTTSYSTYSTNELVTSSAILEQASTRDGNEVYNGTVVWNTVKPVIYNPSVKTVGIVDYDETSNNVFAVGNDIVIPQGTNNSAILLPGRDLSEYKSDTVYMGASVSQNRIATEYFTVSASSGTVYSLTESLDQYPFYYTTWSGSAGNFYYELPDANELDGVQYQFYLDNATSNGTIYVRPSGSQTIEGNPEFPLTITGSTYQFKSFNGEWIPSVNPGVGGGGGGTGTVPTASYISVYDTTDQVLEGPLTASVITFNNVDFYNGITLVSSSRFTVSQSGIYNLEFSAQLNKTSGTTSDVWIWLRKNGTAVSESNTQVHLPGGSNERAVAAWNFYVSASANDYYELGWTAKEDNTFLDAVAAIPNVYPAIPSVIATMGSVGGGSTTISGSGGVAFPYTGSAVITGSLVVTGSITSTLGFTGSLNGTSSFANCSTNVGIINNDQPSPDEVYYYTWVFNTGSCLPVNTGYGDNGVGIRFEANTNATYFPGSTLVLPLVSSSLNYVDDTAAAVGGVPLGGLYRNGNAIMIRLT